MKVSKYLSYLFFYASFVLVMGCSSGGSDKAEKKKTEPPSQTPVSEKTLEFSGSKSVTVNENTLDIKLGYSLSGTFSGSINYSLLESDDSGLFSINPQSGKLQFKEASDYEMPKDADRDNIYNLVIEAKSSDGLSDSFSTQIKVVNVEEKPTLSLSQIIEVKEGEVEVVLLSPSSGDGEVKMTLAGDDRERFVIHDDGKLQFADVPDFELPADSDRNNEYKLTIWLYDNDVQENEVSLIVKVVDDLEVVEVNQVDPIVIDGKTSTGFRMLANSGKGGIQLKIAGGADAKLFKVNQDTFELELVSKPDSQKPNDDNADGKYEIELQGENADGEIWSKSYNLPLVHRAQFNLDIFMPVSHIVPIKLDKAQKFTLSGKLTGFKGLPVPQSEIASFKANNKEVIYDESSGMWNASVYIGNGNQTVQIVVKDTNGNASVVSRYFQVEPKFELNSESGFAFDSNNNWVFLGFENGIAAFDLNTKQRIKNLDLLLPFYLSLSSLIDFAINKNTQDLYALMNDQILKMDTSSSGWELIQDFSKNENPYLRRLRSLTLNPANNEFYLLSEGIDEKAHVFKVDIDKSTTQQITKTDTKPFIVGPGKIEYDTSNDRLLVTDWRTESVLSVSIDSGIIKELSKTNPDYPSYATKFDYPEGMAIDEENNTCWIVDDNGANYSTLMSMDLDSGILTPIPSIGTEAFELSDIAIDSKNNRLLAIDTFKNHLIEIDPSTGKRSTLIGDHIGQGPYIRRPSAIGLNRVNQKAYISSSYASTDIIEVDLLSGNRRLVTGYSNGLKQRIGKGLIHQRIESIEVDVAGGRLFVADTARDAVFIVDIKTGNRELLSSTSNKTAKVGEGIAIPSTVDIEFDSKHNILYAVDLVSDALIAIDTSTGDRQTISSKDVGQGTPFSDPMAVEIDSENGIAYVIDVSLEKIIMVDIKTGARSIMPLSESLPTLPDDLDLNFDQADLELDKKNQILYVGFAQYSWCWAVDLKNGFKLTRVDSFKLGSPMALEVDFDRGIAYQVGYYSGSVWATDIKNSQIMEVSR